MAHAERCGERKREEYTALSRGTGLDAPGIRCMPPASPLTPGTG